MALRVRTAQQAADAFVAGANGAQKAYTDGVTNAGQAWHDGAKAAADTYAAGTQQAIAEGRYARGVEKAGAQHYVDKAVKNGAGRYSQGAANAKGDYQTGVQPFLDTIAAQNLPQRRPKGDPTNIQRVAQIAAALRAKKLQG
jgi:hypothetical protein